MGSLMDLLAGQLGADTVRQISNQIGSDEQTTSKALSDALPALLGARPATQQTNALNEPLIRLKVQGTVPER